MIRLTIGQCFVFFGASYVVWTCGCGLEWLRPIRRFLEKRKKPHIGRKMMKDVDSNAPCCPSCHIPFDKGKRRRLIDSCGHERCFTCVANTEGCNLCVLDANPVPGCPQRGNSSVSTRPRLKTNGYFTTYMQARTDRFRNSPERPTSHFEIPTQYPLSPTSSRLFWQQRRHMRPNTVSIDKHSTLSDWVTINHWPLNLIRKIRSLWTIGDELPHQVINGSDDITKNDFYTRLGLLLGENAQASPRNTPPRPGSTNPSSQESYASISSLASSEANMSGSANTSPLSTLTVSSAAEDMRQIGSNSLVSREPSCDSVASIMSSYHSDSLSPLATNFRRQLSERIKESSPFRKRSALIRRSERSSRTSFGLENRGHSQIYATITLPLRPLFFEVPQTEMELPFIGRQWLFKEIEQELLLSSVSNRGVVITGGPGSGKTALILQLVDYSSFGRRREDSPYHSKDTLSSNGSDAMSISSGDGTPHYQSRLSLTHEAARSLAGRVVAYHFCQADNNSTCLVPEFVHSVAAQLCQSPQLVGYRELFLRDQRFQDLLAMPSCIADPSLAFVKGILEPLNSLRRVGRVPNTMCLIVVDGLNEAEFHRPDYGDTIASFISRHILRFPPWLKVIVTVRTVFQEITKLLPFHHISLDRTVSNESLNQDLIDYVTFRISSQSTIRANITILNSKSEDCSYIRFANHLVSLSKGCMLYLKLTLDLIEKGHLVIKSSSYKVLPVSLSEVYLLSFNLKFTTIRSFERVSNLLQSCLASMCPLTPLELYHSVNAGIVCQPLTWQDFLERLDLMTANNFLVLRQDKTLMFAHPSLREWLIRRQENEGTKFICDVRTGHALLSLRMSRLEAPLNSSQCLELGHHILKAHIYKSVVRDLPSGVLSRDLQALWVHQSTDDISRALSTVRNVYSPNVKVSRLLLIAGANPDCRTTELNDAPLLVTAAHQGYTEMVSLLLEFGADINASSSDGLSPLCSASKQGCLEIVCLLLSKGAKIDQPDKNGRCSLVHAAMNGHLEVVSNLTQSEWSGETGLGRAAQQALVAAAENGYTTVCEFLLDMSEVRVNAPDDLTGQTPLTAACCAGHADVCDVLLRRGASVSVVNCRGEPPLMCAVIEGHWEVVELLLSHKAVLEQTDSKGRTSLMMAAKEGHLGILELLLSKGGSTNASDNEGMTALCWACCGGQLQVAQCLLHHESNIHHKDNHEQTPLDLAAIHGDPAVIQLLLDRGASTEHGCMRPLDRAVACGNLDAVACFLHKGAKLGPQTWAMAEGKADVLHLLLKKLLDDGTTLSKKGRLKEAAYRYQYGLKKFPKEDTVGEYQLIFQQLKFQFSISLSRCKRKMRDYVAAIEAADKAMEIKPKAFEGYYTRARARQEAGHLEAALLDLNEALRLAPQNQDVRKMLIRVKEEMTNAHQDAGRYTTMSTSSSKTENHNGSLSMDFAKLRPLSESAETVLATNITSAISRIPCKPLEHSRHGIETAI
ncbi:protein TANC2-like isoform X3 [Tachypleus tridentatus]|uniref:protein TANC2-like isoform X3 n=1 Tax=Tachypleus tridentatus TaxID=6853 RepID=UPI003FCF30CA